MTTIAIVPESLTGGTTSYRAVAGELHSSGRTPGEALDALTPQLQESESGTLVIVQQMRPDRFFTAVQQQRLAELMQRWREARDGRAALTAEEQVELEVLVDLELKAAAERAEALVRQLVP